jgi:hypothetical protein
MSSPSLEEHKPEVLLRYRNRDVTAEDLRFLRATLAARRGALRGAVAREICEAWRWRQLNGELAILACHDLLARLEEWGYLEPRQRAASTRASRAGQSVLPADLIPLAWTEVWGRDVSLKDLVVRPIQPGERTGWRLFMDRYHYLGHGVPVGEHLLYAAFLGEDMVALLGWAAAAFRVPAREEYVGWDEETKRRRLHLVVNNMRFLVPPWVRVKHLASKVLALNLRRLSSDWEAAYGHRVLLAETFVDTSRFRGTCYRAANWHYLGQTAGRSKRGNAYLYGAVPKAVYVYELHRRARSLLSGSGEVRPRR